MNSPEYDPFYFVVADFEDEIVGIYGVNISPDAADKKAYFGGVVVHGKHNEIENYIIMDIENRALSKGKKIFQTMFYPDSKRLPYAKEHGFHQVRKSYHLEKNL